MNDFSRQTERVCQILQRVLNAKEKAATVLSSGTEDWQFGLSIRYQIMALRQMADQVENLFKQCFGVSPDCLANEGTVRHGLVNHWLPPVALRAYVDFNADRIRLTIGRFTSDQGGHRPQGCLEAAQILRDNLKGKFWIEEALRTLKQDFDASLSPLDEETALESKCVILECYAGEYEQLVARMIELRGKVSGCKYQPCSSVRR